jgi:hypothetical protein
LHTLHCLLSLPNESRSLLRLLLVNWTEVVKAVLEMGAD